MRVAGIRPMFASSVLARETPVQNCAHRSAEYGLLAFALPSEYRYRSSYCRLTAPLSVRPSVSRTKKSVGSWLYTPFRNCTAALSCVQYSSSETAFGDVTLRKLSLQLAPGS